MIAAAEQFGEQIGQMAVIAARSAARAEFDGILKGLREQLRAAEAAGAELKRLREKHRLTQNALEATQKRLSAAEVENEMLRKRWWAKQPRAER